MVDVLEASARAHPYALALDAGDTAMDYRELLAEVTAMAGKLRTHGVGAGDRVGVRVPSGTADLYVAVLAVLEAGAAYVPVDADDPDERAELIWSEARVCAVIGAGLAITLRPEVAGCGEHRGPRPGDDAWVIFTSGTTGRPKGVAVSHRSAAAFVDAEARLFLQDRPLGPGDRVLAGLSVAFDASCEEMWLAWRHGACLVPAPRSLVRTGGDLGPWLVERRITAISTVPTLFALWPVESLERVRLVILGGEACPPELVDRLSAGHRELWNTYGPTETTVVACAAPLLAGQPVRIGVPLDGWDLAVVDGDGHPVRWGESGELLISGVGTARYLDPAKDAERFRTHPALPGGRVYRSGDRVRADREGLVFLGRVDEQVKLAGRRIELGEIDAALRALPGIAAAAAAVRSTATGGRTLVGYLVPEQAPGTTEFDTAAARERLLEQLPHALVPVLALVAELPTRTSGKVDRDALPWPVPLAGTSGEGGPDASSTGTEAWLAERWQEVLGLRVSSDSDFFALGGGSLAAAALVSALRERYPEVSVADLYRSPTPRALAARLDGSARGSRSRREVRRTPRRTGFVQSLVLAGLFAVTGLRWLLVLAAIDNIAEPLPWARHTSWWLVTAGWVVLYSAPARVAIGAGAARLLTRGLRPGTHPRGGGTHLRLWAAERIAGTFGVPALLGTPWASRYARALGCAVGRDVELHAMPPVTGLAEFGDGCAVEREVDLAGWWLDGDLLRIGAVRVGAGARVAARSTLLPGAVIGDRAEVAAGSSVHGTVPDGQLWAGSPARPATEAGRDWPAPRHGTSRRWHVAYGAGLLGFAVLPLLAALPAVALLGRVAEGTTTLTALLGELLAWAAPATVLVTVCYAALLAGVVRLAGRGLTPGFHPSHGRAAWCAWVTTRAMDQARSVLFPGYASLFTPAWLRLLGASVGRRAEVSTALVLPRLTTVGDGAFLADDTLVAPIELRGGWLYLGRSSVGSRAFVGNSGIVGPDRQVPDRALIGVLSDAPAHAEPGTSWLGRPGVTVARATDDADPARTFDPPRRLVVARAAVELCRALPLLCAAALADLVFVAMQEAVDRLGWLAAGAVCGAVLLVAGVVACLLTTAAKWLLVGRFRTGEHPLWSSFVWRNELYDTFVESLAMPWLGTAITGTPMLNAWLRTLGARIGRGVWLESHWLPETDLVRLDDAVSVNRGCVLQTHLFHDRLMRVDTVHLHRGATLGPNSIALPGAAVGTATTVGPASLVMRGEQVPPESRWTGNPIAAHTPDDGR
nr:Pls/PosA family non-ribosomal peptide synthetase [Streptomyces silvisoli]